MTEPRCFACNGWDELFACRVVDEESPDQWTQVYLCTSCWQSAETLHQRRLRERERHLLADWYRTNEEGVRP